jgi:hypothetical protein
MRKNWDAKFRGDFKGRARLRRVEQQVAARALK